MIEVKSIDGIADIHLAQTLTYLRFLHLKLGIVLNFNSLLMKDGIRRVVNGLQKRKSLSSYKVSQRAQGTAKATTEIFKSTFSISSLRS